MHGNTSEHNQDNKAQERGCAAGFGTAY